MTDHIVWNELGLLHYSTGAFPQAIQAYQRAITQNNTFVPAWLNLARAYSRNGNLTEAEKTYYDCLDTEVQTHEQAEIWTQLGQLYAQAGQPEASKNAYHKADFLRKPTDFRTDPVEVECDKTETSQTPEEIEPAGLEHPEFAQIELEKIYINPRQPRIRIDTQNLVESVREHGVLQPIIVSPNGEEGHYILISGHRRLEAARHVGLEKIPAVIREADDRERLELALTENLQRENLSSLEQADAYAQLRDEFALTPEEIARRMGKSSVTVHNLLQQLMLPERIKRALDAGRIQDGHARAIQKLGDPAKQLNAFEQVLLRDLSVRKTEALVRLLNVELEHEFSSPQTEEPIAEETENKEDEALLADNTQSIIVDNTECEISDSQSAPDVVKPELLEYSQGESFDDEADVFVASEEVFFDEEEQDTLIAELFPDIETASIDTHYDSPANDGSTDIDHDEESSPEDRDQDEIEEVNLEVEFEEEYLFDDDSEEITYSDDSLPAEFDQGRQAPQVPSDAEVQRRIAAGEHVVSQNPTNEEAWRDLAENYSFLGENQKAIHAYQEAVALAPQKGSYYDRLGHLYIAQEQYSNAVDAFQKALTLNNENIYVHCALASSYRRMGMLDHAQNHIDFVEPQIIKESPYNRACFESICGNVIQSVELLSIALDRNETTMQKIERDPDFDFIRQDELFIELLQEKKADEESPEDTNLRDN